MRLSRDINSSLLDHVRKSGHFPGRYFSDELWTPSSVRIMSDKSIIKTGGTDAAYDASALGSHSIDTAVGGVMEFIAGPSGDAKDRFCGIAGVADAGDAFSTLRFSFFEANSVPDLRIYESGSLRNSLPKAVPGERLQIVVYGGGGVDYLRNWTRVCAGLATPPASTLLYAKASLKSMGSVIRGVRVMPAIVIPRPTGMITWTNLVNGFESFDHSIYSSGGSWSSGARSNETFTVLAGGNIAWPRSSILPDFTGNYENGMCGLSNADPDQNYTSIQFAIYQNSGNNTYVFESGVNKFGPWTSVPGDELKITVDAVTGVVKYYHNSTLKYTSASVATGTLFVDTAMQQALGRLNAPIMTSP